jgi:ferredoxin, 2Fe-2S
MPKLLVTDRENRTVSVEATSGISLMENIRGLAASVDAVCGGLCACATCHVYVAPDWVERLPPRRYEERLMLDGLASFDERRSRLSCQIRIDDRCDGLEIAVVAAER